MADRYLLESGAPDGYLLEDGSGVYLLEGESSVVLTADDITTGTPTLTSAALGQKHVLLANDILVGTPTLTGASIGQAHVLGANDITAGTPTLTSPALTISVALLANDITVGTPTLTSAAIGQAHVLSADDLMGGTPTLTIPSLISVGGEPAAEETGETYAFRGRRRYSSARPPYYWEALKSEFRQPTDNKSRRVAREVTSGLEELWADLERKDRDFDRMLREVSHLEKRACIYVENLRLSQLLAETKSRIEAAKDDEPETPQEEAEIQEIMRLL